jgi:uncharacterized protein YegL
MSSHLNTINKVYNLIILDESGSMESIKTATINGFNELIQGIKQSIKDHTEISQYVNFFSFNGGGIKEHLPLANAASLTGLSADNYIPDNMTPLYDAIGYSVNKLESAIAGEQDYSVLVTILTDGEENASTEYTHSAIAALIKELKQKGWVFTYIGANHDVEKTSRDLNISNHLSFHVSEEGTGKMFSKMQSSRSKFVSDLKNKKANTGEDFFEDGK